MISFLLGLLVVVPLAQAPPSVAPAEKAASVAGRELAGWIAELSHEDRVVRLRAVRSLAPFGAAAGEALRSALDSDDPAVRYIAAVDLGRMSGEPLKAAVERLTALREDAEHPAVQMATAFALCRSGKLEGNRSLLVERLAHADRAMARNAAELLRTLDPSSAAIVEESRQSTPESTGDHTSTVEPAAEGVEEKPRGANGEGRLNILWITCEGVSPHLGCYGDPQATTPHLDRLAAEGVRFTRAFTPAGVGEVVRSGVVTGMYPPGIGSQHTPSRPVPPPDVRCISEYFRAAGYFCTHRDQGDATFDFPWTAWDRCGEEHEDWRERPDRRQPFFAVVGLGAAVRSEDAGDTPESQQGGARYREGIARIDREVGEVLARLAEDGLDEKTLVVFWSEGGQGAPGGEPSLSGPWLSDGALRVPVIIRWPSHVPAGTVREDLVSVLDLPPTMLAAAGLRVPASLQGRKLVGEATGDEPAYLFFHRDRIHESDDLRRGARDRRWKYIRNFEPAILATSQPGGTSQPGLRKTQDSGQPIEELYDCQKDPSESENLADRPQYVERLARMRHATEQWQQEIGDMGMIPEAVMMHELRPAGKIERTAVPSIRRSGNGVVIYCSTDGASVLYRVGDGAEWSAWNLYIDGFTVESGQRIEAKGFRWGFAESEIAKFPEE